MNAVRQMFRVCAIVIGLSVLANPVKTVAYPVEVKANWDVGTYSVGGVTYNVSYKDAHLVLGTKGSIMEVPPPTMINNGFGSSHYQIQHAPYGQDDTMNVDWPDNGTTFSGKHHIGVDFQMENLGVPGTTVRVLRASLTGVSIPDYGGLEVPELIVPGPTDFNIKRVHSADWTFSISDPALTSPVTFRNVRFYKMGFPPPLASLTAAGFPSLPTTFLRSVDNFTLSPGDNLTAYVSGVDSPEWIIAVYTTSWVDPTLTAWVGAPVTVSVDQWVAGSLYEPPTATVQGTVVLDGFVGDNATVGVQVELRPVSGGDNITRTAFLNDNGIFSINDILLGSYNVAVKCAGWLQTVRDDITVSSPPYDLGLFELSGGDSDGDNQVTSTDLSIVLTNMDMTGNP